MALSLNWDLDSIFPGGSQSPALADFLRTLKTDLDLALSSSLPALNSANQATWVIAIQNLYDLGARLNHASSFITCLVSQNVKDDLAQQLQAQTDHLRASLGTLWTNFTAAFVEQDDTAWANLLTQTDLKEVAFHLNQERDLTRQKMNPALENLANDLAATGYHAWDRLYGTVSGNETVNFDEEPLSLGQLQNRYRDDPNRDVRQRAYTLYTEKWHQIAQTCAMALNNQAGFRLTLYKHRQWKSFLKEPLLNNRLTLATLEAMWQVIDTKSEKLLDYFAAKAKLFGLEQLDWYDVAAPVGESPRIFTYEEAADFVVDTLASFNPHIADYCRFAIDQHWIEAENRPGKRAGAYCTSLPLINQSRIFMTYNGSYNGLLTLAHELGHGYHGWVMRDLPYGARSYVMSLAETASTFNETALSEASLSMAGDAQARLSLLACQLNDTTALLMDIRSRFEFEMAFFARRLEEVLSVDELSALMLTAQKKSFKDGLASYHPLFWASKLHFYLTRTPFYNFPYTFGYLFSNGLYAQALAEGNGFHKRYIALLRDTGRMNTEDLAQHHLGVDLTQPAFWEMAVERVLEPVGEFVRLANGIREEVVF